MKLISVVVPSYNSEKYLEKCVDSLLKGGEDVEIIIVNDGSKDKTEEIANKYRDEYSSIVKVVHKENGGHGDAVMAGLKVATGIYFKVCDSDDWFDENAYKQLLRQVKECYENNLNIDMFISNFVYEKVYANKQKAMSYRETLCVNKVFGWDDFKLKYGKYLLMHSIMCKTNILKESKLELPKHTFYVDNLYVYTLLPYVNKMYYIDVDLYRYFIGRDDQSVNTKNMINRIDQQIYVNKKMVHIYKSKENSNKNLNNYLLSYLEIITTISTIMLIIDGKKESLKKKDELWDYIKKYDQKLYKQLRFRLQGVLLNLPNFLNFIKVIIFKVYQKVWGFN